MSDKDCQELQKKISKEFQDSVNHTLEELNKPMLSPGQQAGIGTEKPNDWFSEGEKFNKTLEV